MKNKFLIMLIFSMLGLATYAQPDMKLGFGLRGGGNFTGRMYEVGAVTRGDRSLIPNFHVGFMLDIPVSADWNIRPEIQYLRGGYKSTYKNADSQYDTTQHVSYLTVPISFNYSFRNVNVKPYISFGPYLGYAVGGNTKTNTTIDGVNSKNSSSIEFGANGKDLLNRLDAGLMLGVGMDLDLITLEFKYMQGLLNAYAGNDNSVYSINFNLGLSVIFFF